MGLSSRTLHRPAIGKGDMERFAWSKSLIIWCFRGEMVGWGDGADWALSDADVSIVPPKSRMAGLPRPGFKAGLLQEAQMQASFGACLAPEESPPWAEELAHTFPEWQAVPGMR